MLESGSLTQCVQLFTRQNPNVKKNYNDNHFYGTKTSSSAMDNYWAPTYSLMNSDHFTKGTKNIPSHIEGQNHNAQRNYISIVQFTILIPTTERLGIFTSIEVLLIGAMGFEKDNKKTFHNVMDNWCLELSQSKLQHFTSTNILRNRVIANTRE